MNKAVLYVTEDNWRALMEAKIENGLRSVGDALSLVANRVGGLPMDRIAHVPTKDARRQIVVSMAKQPQWLVQLLTDGKHSKISVVNSLVSLYDGR